MQPIVFSFPGIRTLSYIWSKLLPFTGRITSQLFHVTDWLPTLYEAAGGDVSNLVDIDGVSQWESLVSGNSTGPRTEALINILTTAVGPSFAILYSDPASSALYKLLSGPVTTMPGQPYLGW